MMSKVLRDTLKESLSLSSVSLLSVEIMDATVTKCPLSKSNVFLQKHTVQGVPITVRWWEVFPEAQHLLIEGRAPATEQQRMALNSLIAATKTITDEKLQQIQFEERPEKVLNKKIAEDILYPLLGKKGSVVMNNIGIGSLKAWYGRPDMLLIPGASADEAVPSVAGGVEASMEIDAHTDSNSDDDDDEEEEEEGTGGSPGDKLMVEGKKYFVVHYEGRHFSQLVSTAITFSFVYGSRHPDKGSLIPAIQIYPSGFTVALYDYKTDCLLMRSFRWSTVTIVFLWCVLHYRLLAISTCDKSRSGYLDRSKAMGGLSELKAEELLYLVPGTAVSIPRPTTDDNSVISIIEEVII